MSDLRTDQDIEQALTEWADQVAPSRAPTRLLESTFARTMGTRQVARLSRGTGSLPETA